MLPDALRGKNLKADKLTTQKVIYKLKKILGNIKGCDQSIFKCCIVITIIKHFLNVFETNKT